MRSLESAGVAFIGGGDIAFDLAHLAARCGSRVTILESSLHPLAQFDREHVERLV